MKNHNQEYFIYMMLKEMVLPYCTCRHKAFLVLKIYACTYPKLFELSNNLAIKEKKNQNQN